MTTLTLELPDALARQLKQKQIGEQEVKAVALAALEIWLAQAAQPTEAVRSSQGRFAESAVPFVRRLISQNRQLFEILARR
jgi:hypothetical protein